ncbi:hypothetical protein EHS25_007747 [Saitozyma podzolica]|uniref:Survival protein SurE-like phosphatase/nucleotidase domain-containing protein n=1 Tax=Saitozyma podzolica TaxID=1890683 RepID=A0A427YQL8_9TREE|nr:hypothetical protein EHS25_007747 [Saitozyma podzolica]
MPFPIYGQRPTVLLTNDDGPPSVSSPNIFTFSKALQAAGFDVKVVVPTGQMSWVGKAYRIKETITLSYFYPIGPDGLQGETCDVSRPLKEGETAEWILLSGTPATCANIGLHHIYPGQIDLVISGPNHGRNSSTAFTLSSGTIGATLSAALSVPIPGPPGHPSSPSLHETHIPCIAVSYGPILGSAATHHTTPKTLALANDAAVEACQRLWGDWGREPEGGLVQVYSINVPLDEDVLAKDKRRFCWTTIRRNTYGSLFRSVDFRAEPQHHHELSSEQDAGPGATSEHHPALSDSETRALTPSHGPRAFRFAPDLTPITLAGPDSLPEGTDAWACAKGFVSITPIRAEYAGMREGGCGFASDGEGFITPGQFWAA